MNPLLACPSCPGRLRDEDDHLTCDACDRRFPVRNGRPRFVDMDLDESADARSMVAAYRAPKPGLQRLRRLITSEYFPGKDWRKAKAATLAAGRTLVIGSGVTRYPDAIHLDLDDFDGVDIVGDAQAMPLQDAVVDGVLCEVVLEHVPRPMQVIAEAFRVLKPGGRFCFITPFVFPYHGHPNDYQRWTKEGLREAFGAFEDVEVGVHGGPCSAMVNLLSEWAYVLSGQTFPRGYVPIKGVATALLFPIKFLDYFVHRFPEAHRLASTLYVTGLKNASTDKA